MILNHLIEIYLIYYFSVLAHELGHLLSAKIIGLEVVGFCLGDNLLSIKYKSVSISPIVVFGRHVEFVSENPIEKKDWEIAFFFFSAFMVNLLLFLLSFFLFRYNPMFANSMRLFNVAILIGNLMPIFLKQNDFHRFLWYCKKATYVSNEPNGRLYLETR